MCTAAFGVSKVFLGHILGFKSMASIEKMKWDWFFIKQESIISLSWMNT